MSAPADLQQRMADLGRKYLDRTAAELRDLQNLIAQIPAGDDTTYKNIEILAHRIRGSGAMFNFSLISDAAFGIEMLAVDAKLGLHAERIALQARFAAFARLLEFVVQAAQGK
ncbi:MAG TPA: Hpt domain-containing protein [Steroidobacteraceae bacterium]|nr:Hpt domain-containing protein [Steroidobacteraceae bacterium]